MTSARYRMTLAVLTMLAAVAVLRGPAPLAAAGGLLLAFVLPGTALAGLLFRGRHVNVVERLVLAPALSLAVLVVAGLVLYAIGVPLDRPQWTAVTAGVTAGALVAATVLGRPAPDARTALDARAAAGVPSGADPARPPETAPGHTETAPGPGRTRMVRQLLPLPLAVVVLATAGWLSMDSVRSESAAPVTALSAIPAGPVRSDGKRPISVTVTGMVAADGPYRLMLTVTGSDSIKPDLRTPTGESWTAMVAVPGGERVAFSLFRAGDGEPFRRTIVNPPV